MEEKKKCTRPGCLKEYVESENVEGCCHYHDGQPIFHDIKKGWSCCNKIVYDWDEFQKIPPCKVGKHTTEKQPQQGFFKSPTVENAQKSLEKNQPAQKILDVNDYNKQQEQIAKEKEKNQPVKEKEIIKNKDGLYFCGNPGCTSKVYDPEKNEEGSCKHHLGQPIFHDRKKMWSCCKAEAYDWDDFEKLPPCAVGKHVPKYKK